MLCPATFTILAVDRKTNEIGVALHSRFFAVGAWVPHTRAGVGAVATQAWFDPAHGEHLLHLLDQGCDPPSALGALMREDTNHHGRQIGIIGPDGEAAAHTGEHCLDWAGQIIGPGFCCVGNGLAGPQVLDAMAETYGTATGPLPERLLQALQAGEAAGGDRRGKQASALRVARPDSGFAWKGDRYIDIRVDDHPDPLTELDRLLKICRADPWGRLKEAVVVLDAELIRLLQIALRQQGLLAAEITGRWDGPTQAAVRSICEAAGLEAHLPLDGMALTRTVMKRLLRDVIY